MGDLQDRIEHTLRKAVAAALGPDYAATDPAVQPAGKPEFGDYQANLAMALGKTLGEKPREVAQRIVDQLDSEKLLKHVEIAGPGFINLTLAEAVLARQARQMLDEARLALPEATPSRRVVVDYSGPNVAKEMHVGHLRSTVIGDCLSRVLALRGHAVHRQNHLGDWGTQFGMLTEYLHEQGLAGQGELDVSDLNALYQKAKKRFDEDDDFATRSRERVVALQSGDATTLRLWRQLVEESKRHFNENYRRLGVQLTDEAVRGESAYNGDLPQVLDALEKAGRLETSQGAAVVFPQGFQDREGEPLPLIVRKSDGGYLYATTDLAAARFRINGEQGLGADWLIYVTDTRQAQHFAMVFQTLRETGWAGDDIRLDHVTFGTILGHDKKPFKTRAGESIRLRDLLDQAEDQAEQVIREKNPDLNGGTGVSPVFDETTRKQVARTIGIGALKYADLAADRRKDYVFDWDRMLSLEGNTAPYLQNAYVRIRSIFRKGGLDPDALVQGGIHLGEPAERALALKLVQLPRAIDRVAENLEPHHLCTFLFELATAFHQFYEKCPVLPTEDETIRASRLALCQLVARVLREGLGWLGIDVVERM